MSNKIIGRPRQTTHDEIRRVAIELFSERGYAATALGDIAAAAGISRTTLFSYFPAKRQLLWEDHDAALIRVRYALDGADSGGVVDLLVAGMLAASTYDIAEHEGFVLRRRLVQEDGELRAYAALRSEELCGMLSQAARERHPDSPPELVDSVARALMAVASRATELWAATDEVTQSLDAFTAARIAPLAAALRPLLP